MKTIESMRVVKSLSEGLTDVAEIIKKSEIKGFVLLVNYADDEDLSKYIFIANGVVDELITNLEDGFSKAVNNYLDVDKHQIN